MKIGIDFGTSYCSMAWLNPVTGRPEVIRDENGLEKVPSIVYWAPDGRHLIGKAAADLLSDASRMGPDEQQAILPRIICNIKRDLQPGRTRPMPDGSYVSAVDVVCAILKELKRQAERRSAVGSVTEVTLTRPVNFTPQQCKLLAEAAKAAGFKKVDLELEPISAVRGYMASGAKVGKTVLVFDLGGGTLDLAFLKKGNDGRYESVLNPVGDMRCAGADFDRIIYDFLDADCREKMGFGFADEAGMYNQLALDEARDVKERLSVSESVCFRHFSMKFSKQYSLKIDRRDYGLIVTPLLDRIRRNVTAMLDDQVKEASESIETVLLIGGSSRMPEIKELLAEQLNPFGAQIQEIMQTDVAVALGSVVEEGISEMKKPIPPPVEEKPKELIRQQPAVPEQPTRYNNFRYFLDEAYKDARAQVVSELDNRGDECMERFDKGGILGKLGALAGMAHTVYDVHNAGRRGSMLTFEQIELNLRSRFSDAWERESKMESYNAIDCLKQQVVRYIISNGLLKV